MHVYNSSAARSHVESLSFAVEEHVWLQLAMPLLSPLRAVRTQGNHTEGGRGAARSVRERHVGCKVVVEAEMDGGGGCLELRRDGRALKLAMMQAEQAAAR